MSTELEEIRLHSELSSSPVGDIARILSGRPRSVLWNELRRFWKMGSEMATSDIWGILATLEANVHNDQMSDEDFRYIAGQVLERARERCGK